MVHMAHTSMSIVLLDIEGGAVTQENWVEISCDVSPYRIQGVIGFKARVGEGWSIITEINGGNLFELGKERKYMDNGPPWTLDAIIDCIKKHLITKKLPKIVCDTNKKTGCVAFTQFIGVSVGNRTVIDQETMERKTYYWDEHLAIYKPKHMLDLGRDCDFDEAIDWIKRNLEPKGS